MGNKDGGRNPIAAALGAAAIVMMVAGLLSHNCWRIGGTRSRVILAPAVRYACGVWFCGR